MSEPSVSRRRWFQFSLTSLFMVTALVAVWLAWELAFVHERRQYIKQHPELLTEVPAGALKTKSMIPWWRELLGDEAIKSVSVPTEWPEAEKSHVAKLFPEATTVGLDRYGSYLTLTAPLPATTKSSGTSPQSPK
jgi:hypothetical protein